VGLARFVDPETGQTFEIDTSSRKVREGFSRQINEEREARKHLLRRLAIDEVPVRTDGNYIEPLLKFFRSRETQVARR
jgi:hypothetical protein